jgi:hypothetical protein
MKRWQQLLSFLSAAEVVRTGVEGHLSCHRQLDHRPFEQLPEAPTENGGDGHTHHSLAQMLLSGAIEDTWTLTAEVLNLLDRRDSEIDYWYESQLRGEATAKEDRHFHPVDPISFRLALGRSSELFKSQSSGFPRVSSLRVS